MKECGYCNRCYEDSLRCCPHDGQALADTLPGGCLIDNKYQLESCIGRGGMGAVYRANHIHLHRPFAIKTILPEFASRDPKAADRFLQEARTAAAIQHPNVVAITDFGITNTGLFYYVMEYIEGKTLRDELHRNGAMSPERAYHIFKQMLGGVSAAHHLHMVHRDLKPSNIMLTKLNTPDRNDFKLLIPIGDEPEQDEKEIFNEIAKVVDFGLAKLVNDSIAKRSERSEGGLVGSPLYMSPEQCDAADVDERSDIYSLGVILYHMLTGEVPFKGDSLSALLTGHLLKDPPSLRAIRPEIPEKLEKVVLKALAKKPALRQQSATELLEEFEAAMAIYLAPESKLITLTIQTVPPACEVYIDDEYRGRTNYEGRLVVKGLPAGDHRARITLTGYLEWAQPFSVAIGESRLEANLQRKEDLALAMANGRVAKPVRRATEQFDRAVPAARGEFNGEAMSFSPKAELSALDILLAVTVTILTMVMVVISKPLDPISASLAETFQIPVGTFVGVLAVLAMVGFSSTIIVADQSPTYRNSTMLSSLFNLSSTLFLLTIIIPLVWAVPVKFFMESNNAPPVYWFIIRLVIISCCFALQSRVRARRRVPFLP